MKVGFDIDGVLANFHDGFNAVLAEVGGRPAPSKMGDNGPEQWDWFTGDYTPEEISSAWARVKTSDKFWSSLEQTENMQRLISAWSNIPLRHDIYFITHRTGHEAKIQTENWLKSRLGKRREITVLMSGDKAGIASSLALDLYIDDKPENVNSVAANRRDLEQNYTKVFLQLRRYNQKAIIDPLVEPVGNIMRLVNIIS